MEMHDFDLIEPIVKNSYLSSFIKDGIYMYFGEVKMLDDNNREWIDACIYREWNKELSNTVGNTLVISKEMFQKCFKKYGKV